MLTETLHSCILDPSALAGALAPLQRDYGAVVLLTADLPNVERRVALRVRQAAFIAALAVCLRAAGDDAAAQIYGRTPRRRP